MYKLSTRRGAGIGADPNNAPYRIHTRRLLEIEAVRHAHEALHRRADVLGVRAWRDVAVLPVPAIRVSVVQAQVVAPPQTVATIAAAAMRDRAHAIANGPAQAARACPRLDDDRRPLVSRHEWKGRWPEPRKIAVDDVRIGAADERCVDAAEHVVWLEGARNRRVLDGELMRTAEHERPHADWLRHGGSQSSVSATARMGEPQPLRILSGNPMKVKARDGIRSMLRRFSAFSTPRSLHIMCTGWIMRTATSWNE